MNIRLKTGGRMKGTPNRITLEIRQAIAEALKDELGRLPETLKSLQGAAKIAAITKLASFVLPEGNMLYWDTKRVDLSEAFNDTYPPDWITTVTKEEE